MVLGLGLGPALADQFVAEACAVAACGGEGIPETLKRLSTSGVPSDEGIVDGISFGHDLNGSALRSPWRGWNQGSL